MLDVNAIRAYFPVINKNPKLSYLDSAASSLKPQPVIDTITSYYENLGVNVHRGVYDLSYKATDLYEGARAKIQKFLNAKREEEIVFTRGASAALNLVAQSYGMKYISKGDEVITSELEHHSSHMPWFNVCKAKGATLKYVELNEEGRITVENFKKALTDKTKLVALTYVSIVMGYITPIKEIIKICHERGIVVSVDGAQAVPHMKIDVQDLDCDFFVFSGHKMYAPMGIGGLYGRAEWLEKLPPYQFGGEMVDTVSFEKTTFNVLPFKFEAGTPNVGAALGLETAVQFLQSLDREKVERYEAQLLQAAIQQLSEIEGIRFIGEAKQRSGLVSFVIDGIHPYDLGTIIDKMGVAVRTGHHCAEPVMTRFGIPGTVRASFALYNTLEEVEIFVKAVKKAAMMLR